MRLDEVKSEPAWICWGCGETFERYEGEAHSGAPDECCGPIISGWAHGQLTRFATSVVEWTEAHNRDVTALLEARRDLAALEADGKRRDNEYIEVCYDLSVKADLATARAEKAADQLRELMDNGGISHAVLRERAEKAEAEVDALEQRLKKATEGWKAAELELERLHKARGDTYPGEDDES